MGKTYRRDDERRKHTREDVQPEHITPEWALERMEPAVDYAVRTLVDSGIIEADEMEDCAQEIRVRVARAAGMYDKERLGLTGRRASAVHYLTVVIESTRKNIIRAAVRYARSAKMVSLDENGEGDVGTPGESACLSDISRSFRELEWNMDMATLRELMSPRECAAFDMMIEGHAATSIMDEIGVYGGSFYRHVIEPLRCLLGKCGYAPLGQNTDS